LDQHTIMKVFSTLSAVFMAKAGLADPQFQGVQMLANQPLTYTVGSPVIQPTPLATISYGNLPAMTQVYNLPYGRESYPIVTRFVKRETQPDEVPSFTYSVMAQHPSEEGMDKNRYNMFRMDNQMNRPFDQQYRMNNLNQLMGRQYPRSQMDQYRLGTNQMNTIIDQQQQRMMNGQMNRRMNGDRQAYQMNRPNRMFNQRINAVNQMDGQQRLQYRMDNNQVNQMTQMNQMNQMTQMNQPNQLNQMNQMTQRNQLSQLDNRRFKRGADSDFVAYRTMTATPFQRSHSEVVMNTDPQPIQLIQGSYTQGYSFPTLIQGPVNQGYSIATAPLMRSMAPTYMTYY